MSSLSTSPAGRGRLALPPSAWMKKEVSFSSVVASWLMASRARVLLAAGLPSADRPKYSMPSWWSPARLPHSLSVPSFLSAGVDAVSGSPSA